MSNLQQFFGGTGGGVGTVPLRGLVPFPYDTPNKVYQGSQVFVRSGFPELIEYDPSLQSWVDDNIMFVNTQSETADVTSANRGLSVDTDGAGKWMVAGWQNISGRNLPAMYFSQDDGINWTALPGLVIPINSVVKRIRFGGADGIWIAHIAVGSTDKFYRTTDNGETWTDITLVIWPGGGVIQNNVIETNRLGTWFIISPDRTTFMRSTDNGASWSSVSLGQQAHSLKYGGGTWVVMVGNATASPFRHTHVSFSTNNGASWSGAIPLSIGDLAYVGGSWKGAVLGSIYDVSADFTKLTDLRPQYPDTFTDMGNQNQAGWLLRVGLDGVLWLIAERTTFRSKDAGVTWTKYQTHFPALMSGPNKRTVAIVDSSSADIRRGIATGGPAAGCHYSILEPNDGVVSRNRRSVMYMRTK